MSAASTDNHELAIETRHLAKRYRNVVALRDLSITVERGEVFGFLGPNGAGKSTAVKLLTGLARPTNGTARVLGHSIGDRRAKSQIGYLPELFRFHNWLSAREFLDVHARLYGIDGRERSRRIDESLDLVGLADRADERLSTFSKGMQQRAGLAQALLHQPQLVFLDEPTSALDPIGRRLVRDVIRELRVRGTTVFLNSHLLTEVEQVSDRVAILNRGSVVAIGSLDELMAGEFRVSLRLSRWDAELASQLADLAQLAGTPEAGQHGTHRVTLVVADECAVPALVSRLVDDGVEVYEVAPGRLTLEDLFVGLVEESEGIELTP